jgi:dipeptidyl aminopeptidase/acylaminoacyl peptidase
MSKRPAFCFFLAALACATVSAEARDWTLEDAVAAPFMDDVRISPDGAYALLHVVNVDVTKNAESGTYRLVRIADGTSTAVAAGLEQPRWSPSGASIAWLRGAAGGATHITITDSRGLHPRDLTHDARAIVGMAWSPRGDRIAAVETPARTAARAARVRWMNAESDYLDTLPPKRDVYVVDAKSGRQTRVTNDSWSYGGPVTDHDPSWSPDGAYLALVRQPTPRYGSSTRNTSPSTYAKARRSRSSARFFRIPARLIVEPHGGPQCADDAAFDAFGLYLAAHGYAYFRPGPRGSDGYGDWSYKAIVGNWGEGPAADIESGIDALLARGIGRADRIYVEGGSYGGYMTTWLVSRGNRYRAAVAEVPVTNMLLDYTLSESPNITRRFFGAKPSLDQALLARESPLSYAKDVHAPLLIMIGLRDTRAPYPQAIEYYKTVEEAGGDTRLFADSQAGHGPDDPQGALLWLRTMLGWLTAHGAPPLPGAMLPPG